MIPPPDEADRSDEGKVVDGSDRRSEERHAITLRVDYKRMNTFFADYAKNISKGGTFIRTSKPLDVGTEFVFVLCIPGQPDSCSSGRGHVDGRRRPATEEHPAGMGIRFRFTEPREHRRSRRSSRSS